jgi:hypothetical protein
MRQSDKAGSEEEGTEGDEKELDQENIAQLRTRCEEEG